MSEKKVVEILPTKRNEFFIRCEVSDYWMDFECVKCIGVVELGNTAWSRVGAPLYDKKDELKDKPGGLLSTEIPTEGLVYMKGFLKWDGCMEVERESNHYCEVADVEAEFDCIRKLREIADSYMASYEGGLH